MSKADRELSGNFAAKRGKLPMPISGAYIITSRYGQYAVEGLRNVLSLIHISFLKVLELVERVARIQR